MSTYPSINDREFDLLKKIATNTAELADTDAGDVSSIAGTAGQITASAATGDVVLSIPAGSNGQVMTTTAGVAGWAASPTGTLPSQTSNSGKLLTTDGTNASWTTTGIQTSLTAPAATNLTLAGGSSGASLVLGQGATASTLAFTGVNQWLLINGTAASNGYTFRSARQGTTLGFYHSTTYAALGTVSNHPLDFLTFDGSTQMRLTTTGNLLIGTTTDMSGSAGLKVAGTTAASSSTAGAFLVGNGTAATNVAIGGGKINVGSTEASTSSTTGAGIFAGGIYAGAASVFGGDTITQSAAQANIILNSTTAANPSFITFQSAGTSTGFIGQSQSNNLIITGASSGDMVLRTQAKNFRVSTDSGSTSAFTLAATTGAATFAGAIRTDSTVAGGFAQASVMNNIVAGINLYSLGSTYGGTTFGGVSGSNQSVVEANASASSLYLGTAGATSVVLAPNRTAALTLAPTTLAATFAGAVTIAGTVIHTLSATPASASAAGTVGTMSWDASYIYICTATNTWKRVAIATW
jgi:hypothetical protein